MKFEATDKWYKDAAESETDIPELSAGMRDENNLSPIEIEYLEKFTNLLQKKLEKALCKWISVKDKLPEDKQTVITSNGNNVFPGFYHDEHNFWLCWSGWKNLDLKLFDVTHWMPLPKLPEMETKGTTE